MQNADKGKQPQHGRRAITSSENSNTASSSSSSSLLPNPAIIRPAISGSNVTIPYNKIAFTGDILGEGSFGIVKKAAWQYTDVAVKELRLTSLTEEATEEFRHEAQHHGNLRHPNIVTLYGVCMEPGHYCMVMELMPEGSLYKLLHSKSDFPWMRRFSIAEQIAIGLNYLHEQNIIHRDLKSLNILLNGQHAKLTDFGLSKIKAETGSTCISTVTGTSTSTYQQPTGSLLWTAPELFKRKNKHTELTDIYALGMVFWEIASRRLPFNDAAGNQFIVMQWIKQGELNEIPEDTPLDFAELIKCCWEQKPESRPQKTGDVIDKLKDVVELYQATSSKSWHFDPTLKRSLASQVKEFELILATEKDFQKVLEQYQKHPAEGYEIKSVETIYNPVMNRMFADNLRMLQSRQGNQAYLAKFGEECKDEEERKWRTKIHHMWQVLVAPYADSNYPQVKLLPLWHGTKRDVLRVQLHNRV